VSHRRGEAGETRRPETAVKIPAGGHTIPPGQSAQVLELPAPSSVAVLVFDGDCGFCTSSAAWIARHWKGPERSLAWQQMDAGDLTAAGLTGDQVASAAWWIDEHGRAWGGHLAVAKAMVAAGGAWGGLGRLTLVPPFRWSAAAVYRLVVRYRYRLPGGTPACRPPVQTH